MTEHIVQHLYIGKSAHGDRVYIDVRVRELSGERVSVTHEPVSGGQELSIMGTLLSGGSDVGGGQCLWDAESVLNGGQVARGANRADIATITAAWRRWHLNAMRPGCAHMGDVTDDPADMPACPVTGYQWGHAWLYEPLPDGLVDDLRAACARLANR